MNTENTDARLDRAVASRLAKLRAMPVDTARLEAALRDRLPPPPDALPSASPARPTWYGTTLAWLGPVRAAAASLFVVAALAAVLLTTSAGPALAAPADMAAVHRRLVAGEIPVTRVGSVEEAGRVLRDQWAQSPELPTLPAEHVAACCLVSVDSRRVACLLLDDNGRAVSVVVARADDFRLPDGQRRTVNGIEYRVKSSGTVNMVLAEHDGRIVCVMGEVDADRLIKLAGELRF